MMNANWLWLIVPACLLLGAFVRGLCENSKDGD